MLKKMILMSDSLILKKHGSKSELKKRKPFPEPDLGGKLAGKSLVADLSFITRYSC